ncbi:MAG: Rieske 2Fe-2S domain-containing protein, partial [Ktedonobacteraceae bacterium]|nr:Rieske 2Fe-2S domain-containing protein [Ktedonobacteraceae bacterium]
MDESIFDVPHRVASLARRRLSRRGMLSGLTSLVIVGSAGSLEAGCSILGTAQPAPTATLYPNLQGQFGSVVAVGSRKDFPAARIQDCKLGQAGVFYNQTARCYIVHLVKATEFLLAGARLEQQLTWNSIVRDSDGSYWLALYYRCTHLGCMVPFRNDCVSFNCPCHTARFNVDGTYISGPSPRGMDRFILSFQGDEVV